MISYPINFDDLNLFLNCNKNKVEGTINEMIRIGLGLFDPTGFSKSKPMIAERMTDEIRLLRNQITGLFGEDENIIQYISGIALINILLIEKNKGWKDLYNKIYFSYLERVEELMRVVLGEVRFN
jgi:hypothetical protein